MEGGAKAVPRSVPMRYTCLSVAARDGEVDYREGWVAVGVGAKMARWPAHVPPPLEANASSELLAPVMRCMTKALALDRRSRRTTIRWMSMIGDPCAGIGAQRRRWYSSGLGTRSVSANLQTCLTHTVKD